MFKSSGNCTFMLSKTFLIDTLPAPSWKQLWSKNLQSPTNGDLAFCLTVSNTELKNYIS